MSKYTCKISGENFKLNENGYKKFLSHLENLSQRNLIQENDENTIETETVMFIKSTFAILYNKISFNISLFYESY